MSEDAPREADRFRPWDARRLLLRLAPLVCELLVLAQVAHLQALGTGKPLREYGQQAWQSDSGLPQNTVRAIAQTGDGYLWIGTEAGLVRFDGVDFAVYDTGNTPALHSDLISSLKQDSHGSLWIGTPAGLVRERAGVFAAIAAGLPTSAVLALYLTHSGRLLALTTGGAATLDERDEAERFVPIIGTDHLGLTEGASMVAEDARGEVSIAGPQGTVSIEMRSLNAESIKGAAAASIVTAIPQVGEMHALAAASNGELWVGGASGLAVLGNGVRSISRRSLPSSDVTSLLAAADGGMWIGTSKGLALALRGVIKPLRELAGRHIDSLFLDRAGSLWVATSDGLARVADGKVDLGAHGLPVAGILSIFEDREGSMWFGTDTAGLHVLRDQAFSQVTTEDGLSANLVRAVFEDHAGTMWIGTSGGGLDRFTDGRATAFAGKLPSKVVLALAETQTGAGHDLWLGTPEGLVRIRGAATRVFTTADGLADDFVRSLYPDRDGSLWIGTRNGLSHYTRGVFHSYSKLDGLASDLVGTILRSRDGELWVGTLGGLSRMSGEEFVPATVANAIPEGAVTALLEDKKGSLWVGINGRGLSRLRFGTSPQAATLAAPNLPATIYGMLQDADGDLWLGSRTGVDRVGIAALDAHFAANRGSSLPVTHYGSADGMRISEASGGGHPAAWRARDGGLWFATLNGAAVVHPRPNAAHPLPPLSAIEQVLIDEQPAMQSSTALRVPPGHGRLSIRYAGLSFVAPQRVRYRYKLQGFDKGWIDAGARRTAFYTNVPPGSYTFMVRSANSDDVWSVSAAEQRFMVEPYFYQTGWFYALAALSLAGFGYLIYKWRVLTVEARYQAVLEERSRIAREIHDTLAQGYVAVSVQLEIAERLLMRSTEAALQQMKQTKEMVREGLAEARSSIWNLRSQTEAETLPALLAAHVGAVARRLPGSTMIKFTVHGAYRPLERTVEEEVLRIAQQAVANAVAHAHASSITVTLDYDAQLLALQVADDGVGMRSSEAESAPHGHFGLRGMRERAARIEALLEIKSERGHGVMVTLGVDLRRAARKDPH